MPSSFVDVIRNRIIFKHGDEATDLIPVSQR